MSTWVYLGAGMYVRADEVVAVRDGCSDGERQRMVIPPYTYPKPSAVVVLRGMHLVPAYLQAKTVITLLQAERERG